MAGAANAGTIRARLTLENSEWKSRMNEAKKDMRGLSGSCVVHIDSDLIFRLLSKFFVILLILYFFDKIYQKGV